MEMMLHARVVLCCWYSTIHYTCTQPPTFLVTRCTDSGPQFCWWWYWGFFIL